MATLDQKDINEAIIDWCKKKGIVIGDKTTITIKARHMSGTLPSPISTDTNYKFVADIDDIEILPPKDGPYR